MKNVDSSTAIDVLNTWEATLAKKESRLKSQSKVDRKLSTARSVARQSIESLKRQRPGHLWIASRGAEDCAVLIADDYKDGFTVCFLVSNVLDSEAKGSGTFLVQNMLDLASRTHKTVRTTPENAEKYWGKMGFRPDLLDSVQYVYTSEVLNDGAIDEVKYSKSRGGKKKS